MSRILIVEDDPDIAQLIAHYLQKSGHTTECLTSGSCVVAHARGSVPDIVLLDLMLPGMDGLMVCQALRAHRETAAIPIIMLTARADEGDRIAGLELGADDYVTKPFSPGELTARVAALLRRAHRAAVPAATLRYGPLVIDVERHAVRVNGEEVRLTAKEFLLLQYLVEHR
ncbi:MAG TPA: response regulator transcription factor, partial [Vicinamibacterales bacterium]|nr:response regulator transcription factor [Vicinamibacterales bacterium]